MDWQIQRFGRVSTVTGRKFEPGDLVVCLIYVGPEGDIQRADMHQEEEADFDVMEQSLLGRWVRSVKEKLGDEDNSQSIQSTEDLFLGLFQHDRSEDSEEVELLKHFLGLMLERRRVLKPEGPRAHSGQQTYIHTKSKQSYQVPVLALEPEMLLRLHELFEDLIL
ncbi:MAG: hypothetical protein MK080_00320 [Opitutales bacterium]|nr:hypothetical protein [Opitutales bacterium]NRA27543.1 hypothetical protein [Opitutales bacterium]